MKLIGISKASFAARGFLGALGWSVPVLLALPALSGAQTARDSALYIQAQQMVANGDAAAGRRLADSVASAAQPGTPAFAEGLYWKATLATNARDSEHAYRQIIVDYPLSGRVPDALLRIGQLESARGDNAAALQHFQRLVLEHPLSPLRAEASYWVAQSYFSANDPSHACSANADALASVSSTNVELKNRIDFQQQRCRGVALATNTPATPVAVPVDKTPAEKAPAEKPVRGSDKPSTRVAKTEESKVASKRASKVASSESVAKSDTEVAAAEHHDTRVSADTQTSVESGNSSKSGVVSRAPTKEEVARALESAQAPAISAAAKAQAEKAEAKSAAATARPAAVRPVAPEPRSGAEPFAVQIAAFGTKPPATLLVAKMRGRGYNAYIDGTRAPYRVRIGRYPTYAAASAELVRLKAKKIDGFVADR